MRLITKRSLVATAAARFRDTYQRRDAWLPAAEGFDPASVYAALVALPADADEAAVVAAAGDERWTANFCNECGQDAPVTVLLAEQIGHDTDSVLLCPDCLETALTLTRDGAA